MFVMPNLSGGGAEKVLIDIINNIDIEKFEVTVVLFKKEGVYLKSIPTNVKLISMSDKLKGSWRIWYKLFYIFPNFFYKLFVKENFDIEIAFMEGWATKFVANSNNKGSKKIAWVHCDIFSKHWTNHMFKKNEESECYNKFNEIIFVSNDSKGQFNKLFKNIKTKQKIIYNPVIADDVYRKANEQVIKFEEFTFISVGRLDQQKGFDRLIEAHSRIVKKYPHKLIILGEGLRRREIEKQVFQLGIGKSVELMGFKKNPYPYIKAADAFICSSRSEGYSLVVVESIILGKAILSTNVNGPKEILENGKYGLICENSIDGIENSMKMILKDRSLVGFYEQKSEEKQKFLDYEKCIKEIEDLFQ